MGRGALFITAGLLVSGCGAVSVDMEMPPPSLQATVVDDCIVPPPAGIADMGSPISLEFDGVSMWLWGEARVTEADAEGKLVLPNVATLVSDPAVACAGGLDMVRDGTGLPTAIIPLTPEEKAENATRTDGKHITIAPQGGFVAGGIGYLYYDVVLAGPGILDGEVVDTGICTLPGPGTSCARGASPLWTATDRSWAAPGVVDGEGYAYLIRCFRVDAFNDVCGLARVRPEESATPGAYRFYNSLQGWIDNTNEFSTAFAGARYAVIGFNSALGQTTAVSGNIWNATVELRTADAPTGTWSAPLKLVKGVPPPDWFISGGVEHASLRSPDQQTLRVTYHTGAEAGPRGLHLVTVQLGSTPR